MYASGSNELGHVAADAAQQRTHRERGDGKQHDAAAAEQIPEFAQDGSGDGGGEDVGGAHPGVAGEPVELARDGGQGGTHDGAIKGRQGRAQHERAQDDPQMSLRHRFLTLLLGHRFHTHDAHWTPVTLPTANRRHPQPAIPGHPRSSSGARIALTALHTPLDGTPGQPAPIPGIEWSQDCADRTADSTRWAITQTESR